MPHRSVSPELTETRSPPREDPGAKFDPEVLVASMASQRAALISAPAPYILITTDGETVLLNTRFVQITGFTIDDLPDIRTIMLRLQRIPEEKVDPVLAGWLRTTSAASVQETTIWTVWNEMRIWQVCTTDPVLWPDGRTVLLKSIFDLTEQRRLEEALRRNQDDMRNRLAELEALYSSAPLGLAMLDNDLRYMRVNAALAAIHGLPAADHIGRHVFEIVPELRTALEPALRRVLETRDAIGNLEFRGETSGRPGDLRDWRDNIYPLSDARGAAVGIGVIVEDVTREKKVQAELADTNVALKRTLDLLYLALKTAGVSVFTQDEHLNCIWIGGECFGQERSTAIVYNDESVVPLDLIEPMAAMKSRVRASGQPLSADMPYELNGKTRWCNVHIEPWTGHDGAGKSLLGAVSDITPRKATEQHVRTLMSELAHRSKNLLTVIQVMARRSVSPGVPSAVFVDSFVERLSGLAQSHDLLAREDWRGISMHELLASQIGHLKSGSADRLSMDGPNIQLTPVAAQNLGMAIHELSTNAIKYGALSVTGGQVSITWSIGQNQDQESRIRLAWTETGGPPVATPIRRGFGRFVIEAIAARALSGTVDLRFDPQGVSCFIEGAADDSVIAGGAKPDASVQTSS